MIVKRKLFWRKRNVKMMVVVIVKIMVMEELNYLDQSIPVTISQQSMIAIAWY
jgi:hypothetical protein